MLLARLRYRLKLRRGAMPRIEHTRQLVGRTEFIFIQGADLLLIGGFSGVVLHGAVARLARIRRHLRRGEPQGILHEGRLQRIGDERQAGGPAQSETQFRIEIVALRVAVEAIPVGLKMRCVDDVIDHAVVALGFQCIALRVERAVLRPAFHEMARLCVLGEDRDHAARGVAVERGEGAAQHLHTAGRSQIELRELALAVGHGSGNAVRIQTHAAYTEARACAETAHRQLFVLRVILPVFRRHARHRRQRLRDIDLQLPILNGRLIHSVDRGGNIEARFGNPRGRDHHRVQFRRGLGPRTAGTCAEQQHRAAQNRTRLLHRQRLSPCIHLRGARIMLCHSLEPRILRSPLNAQVHPFVAAIEELECLKSTAWFSCGRSSNVSWSRGCRCLVSSAALLLPSLAATESQLQTGAAGTAIRAAAHVDFKIIIPSVLSLDVAGGAESIPGAHTVSIFSNSRNVALAASVGASDNARGNLILSAAARRIISQHAACTLGLVRPAGVADTSRVLCTVSMP